MLRTLAPHSGYNAAQLGPSHVLPWLPSSVSPSHQTQDADAGPQRTRPHFGMRMPQWPRGIRLKQTIELSPEVLKAHNIRLLFIDWDNTFCSTFSAQVHPDYQAWLKRLKASPELHLVFLSNDLKPRAEVKAFAQRANIPHVHNAKKPFAHPSIRAYCKQYGVPVEQAALVDENFSSGGLQALLMPGLRYFWPEPIDARDPKESWLLAKLSRYLSRLLFSWSCKPLTPLPPQDSA